ncbi:MAG: LysR family transcriptional regulator [Gammaproteobacteria bacterium]|nr:LysR family transcriptional regulator [Gammaproteobacteria bacterium]
MNITIRQLKVFLEVATLQSFTLAAKNLHLTQPAVSMQIKQLEEVVGTPLLAKHGRKITLTDAGHEMLMLSRNVLQQIDQTQQHLKQITEGHQGRLKLVVASTVSAVATKLLASFNELHPAMHISFDVTNRQGLLQQLENSEADIVLMGQPPENLNLITVAFMDNPLVVIASPKHPLASLDKPATLSQLLSHGFVIREPGSGTRMAMERFFNENNKTLNTNMEMNSNDAIKQSVETGLGLGVASMHTLEHELREKRLKIIPAEGFPIRRSWYLVQRKDKRLSPLAEKFRDYVLEHASRLELIV